MSENWRDAYRECNGPPKPEPPALVQRIVSWITGKEREAEHD